MKKLNRKQLRSLIMEQMESDILTNRDSGVFQYDEKLPQSIVDLLKPHLDSGMLTGPDYSKQKAISIIDSILRAGEYTTYHGDRKGLSRKQYSGLQSLRKRITGKDALDYFDAPDLDAVGAGISMEALQNRFRRQQAELHAALDAGNTESIAGLQQALQYTVDDIKAAGGNPGFM